MTSSSHQLVGRLAPSPTGGLHLGHARTFFLAWLAAKSAGGRIVLRVEDIDASRARPEAVQGAVEDLRWLGLTWDEGPHLQSTRRSFHDQALDRLRRSEMLQIEPALLHPDLLIGAFEHREVEIILLADVIIQHALVGAGFGRDPVDAGAGEAMRGEFLLGGLENAKPHPLGMALPLQNSLCLGQKKDPPVWDAQANIRKKHAEPRV